MLVITNFATLAVFVMPAVVLPVVHVRVIVVHVLVFPAQIVGISQMSI